MCHTVLQISSDQTFSIEQQQLFRSTCVVMVAETQVFIRLDLSQSLMQYLLISLINLINLTNLVNLINLISVASKVTILTHRQDTVILKT
jgi:hypothetical protein